MTTRIKKLDKSIKTAVGGPVVAAGYYVIGYAVRYVSCLPTYSDAEFADIPVTQFLLLALTGAALILTVFAMLAGFRLYRQSIRARANPGRQAMRWGLAGIALGALSFAAIAAGAMPLLGTKCP